MAESLKKVLNDSLPGRLEAALGKMGNLGDMLACVDEVLTAPDDTTDTLQLSNEACIISCVSVLTVPMGGAALGPRIIGEDASTASATVVRVDDDKLSLQFEDFVSTVRVKYMPLPAKDLSGDYADESK